MGLNNQIFFGVESPGRSQLLNLSFVRPQLNKVLGVEGSMSEAMTARNFRHQIVFSTKAWSLTEDVYDFIRLLSIL